MTSRLHRIPRLVVLIGAISAAPGAMAQSGPSTEELNAKVDALASEVNRLRESLSVPEEDEKMSQFGLGPAASKVYAADGLSIGGYGELFLGHSLGDDETRSPHRGDTYRFITYLGYKFSDQVVFNTELEFEHADQSFVEFMYVDLLLSEALNIRTGLMLMPMGIVNEMHEPTTYRGNFRPETERRIIPSTWREAGIGLLGSLAGVDYRLYLVSGLSAEGFGPSGVRGGRQKGSQFTWEDKGVVARVEWGSGDAIRVGGSVYYGGADQDPTGELEVNHLIYEAHAIGRFAGLELRGLFAENRILDGADDLSAAAGAAVPEVQRGFYVEVTYDVAPLIGVDGVALTPFFRFERLDLQVEVPEGYAVDDSRNGTHITAGLEYKPVPDVVFKGEFEQKQIDVEGADPVQELRLGIGFIF